MYSISVLGKTQDRPHLSSVFASRSRIENISVCLKVIHLEPLRDINKPLSRQFKTHRNFSTLVRLTFLSYFSHRREKKFLIMAEISQLFLTLVCLKVNLMRQFWENPNPRKVKKSRIWFVDLKWTDNFESTRWDFLTNQNHEK